MAIAQILKIGNACIVGHNVCAVEHTEGAMHNTQGQL